MSSSNSSVESTLAEGASRISLSSSAAAVVSGSINSSSSSGGSASSSNTSPGGGQPSTSSSASSTSAPLSLATSGLPLPTVPSIPVMKPSGSKFTSVTTISFAEDMNPSHRSTMEDACVVLDGFGGDSGTGFFAVYDGHGGRNVAEYLRLHLHGSIERELQVKGDRSVEECLRAAFLLTDVECSATGEQASGSTAVVCIVRRSGPKRYVYTANCGDARAVLCHAGIAVRLSCDHKATDAVERARIEAAGGFVIRKRVMGVLAIARSFGDYILKKYVTTDPFTSTTKLDGMSSFIIVACDGVWDVMEDQEAVDLVKEHVGLSPSLLQVTSSASSSTSSASAQAPSSGVGDGGGGDSSLNTSKVKTAAQMLVDQALSRGTSDNVTVLVVFL